MLISASGKSAWADGKTIRPTDDQEELLRRPLGLHLPTCIRGGSEEIPHKDVCLSLLHYLWSPVGLGFHIKVSTSRRGANQRGGRTAGLRKYCDMK